MQKATLILMVALAASGEASFLSRTDLEPGLSVKFSVGRNPGIDFFYPVPLNKDQALNDTSKWIETPQPDDVPELYKELVMYCYECEGPICALYEPHSGFIAGLQIGIEKNKLSNTRYDLLENGFTEWTWTCGGVSRTHYTIRQYYMTKEFLSKSPSSRISSYNTSKILQDDGVVTVGPGGKMLLTPPTAPSSEPSTHYYYKMSKTTECSAKTLYPWFMLIHGDNDKKQSLIGCAMMTFGKVSEVAGSRDWFEEPIEFAVEAIVKDGPQCLYDYAKTGVITMHIYFVKSPNKIYC